MTLQIIFVCVAKYCDYVSTIGTSRASSTTRSNLMTASHGGIINGHRYLRAQQVDRKWQEVPVDDHTCSMQGFTQQTVDAGTMLACCWSSVADAGPASGQYCASDSGSMQGFSGTVRIVWPLLDLQPSMLISDSGTPVLFYFPTSTRFCSSVGPLC